MNTDQTVWFWGDSWSVPNYMRPMPNYRSKYHSVEIMADLGFAVRCNAENGNENLFSIERSYIDVTENHQSADWIIWFHTAVFRDAPCHNPSKDSKPCSECMLLTAEKTYQLARDVVDKSNAKLIVIEGHAPVYEPYFSRYLEPDLFLKNWRGEILGMPDLPQSHWYNQYPDLIEDTALTTEYKTTEVEKLEKIVTAVDQSPLFPDNSHPGDIAYIHLTAKMLDFIDKH